MLTEEEFRRFHERFLPQPLPVALQGYGTVHLRMAHGVYPYIGVDFGGGANALFDRRTMFLYLLRLARLSLPSNQVCCANLMRRPPDSMGFRKAQQRFRLGEQEGEQDPTRGVPPLRRTAPT